jgi:amino-acid N-acetyltransferase
MHTRNAVLPDAPAIERLIAAHSADGTLLPRNFAEICENIRDFVVVEDGFGEIIGCGALHLYGMHLAEIRSITVDKTRRAHGAGAGLMAALFAEAERQSVKCVCLFTRIPDFFSKYGFRQVEHDLLPDKAHKDCIACPRRHACDEIAMVHGELPDYAHLTAARGRQLPIWSARQ